MGKRRQFHIGNILSAMTGRLVAPQPRLGEFETFLEFMGGGPVAWPGAVRTSKEAGRHLAQRFPEIAAGTESAIAELDHIIAAVGPEYRETVVDRWLALQASRYGEMLEVEPLQW